MNQNNCRVPNFILVGAMKAGTTALCRYLAQHPDVFIPELKEPHYFLTTCKTEVETLSYEEYLDLFTPALTETAIGEGSTWYLYDPGAAKFIHDTIPSTKIIAILRNPCDRAFSHFMYEVRDAKQNVQSSHEIYNKFIECIETEDITLEERYWTKNGKIDRPYIKMGMYSCQLNKYYRYFQKEKIKVVLYEDFSRNPIGTVNEIFRFIGVDCSYKLEVMGRVNVSGYPKSRFIHNLYSKQNVARKLIKQLIPSANLRKRITRQVMMANIDEYKLFPEIRKKLITIFEPDILNLQKQLSVDLSEWLKV